MTDSINNPTPDTLGMPPLEDLAVATIQALVIEGYTSSVMKLSRPTLNEMARRLATEGHKREDTLDWLRDSKGITEAALPTYTLDRFFQRFREKLDLVNAAATDRSILAQIAADKNFSQDDYQLFVENKYLMLAARSITSASPDDLGSSQMKSILTLVQMWEHGKVERAKLDLAGKQSERQTRKLESDLALANKQADQRERKLQSDLDLADERVRKLQMDNEAIERKHKQALEAAKIETTRKASGDGGKLSESDVLAILDRAMKGEL